MTLHRPTTTAPKISAGDAGGTGGTGTPRATTSRSRRRPPLVPAAALAVASALVASPPRGSGLLPASSAEAFALAPPPRPRPTTTTTTALRAAFGGGRRSGGGGPPSGLSPLPRGISPFEKSISKNLDIQAEFRRKAKAAIDAAVGDGAKRIEIEFPPLLGGSQSKSQFDDFDNIQELDRNKEWTMLLAPMFLGEAAYQGGKTWLVFPDLKECELAKAEWAGKRYREATFTTIEEVTNDCASSSGSGGSGGGGGYDAPWGSSLMSGLSSLMGGEDGDAGLLGDQGALDDLGGVDASLWLVIQPGNGGPVEDWVNCEKMAVARPDVPMVIVNGALDKVRGGFYPGVFFPKLAATVDRFYRKFESAFYLKPFSDKGVYGWLYRVYPEPWQVVYEDVTPGKDGNAVVEYVTVDVLDERPSYDKVVSMLLGASRK